MDSNLSDSDKSKVGIYLLRNKDTNEVYVGSGKLNNRFKSHKRELENNNHVNYKLQRSFNKHPDIEFIGSPIDVDGLTIEENRMLALSLEQIFIDKLKDNEKLLNIALNVETPTLGLLHTEESKKKISKKSIEMWDTMSVDKINNRNEKISKAQKEHWSSLSEEEKNNRTEIIRHASLGRQLSEQHKKKVGDFFRGKELTTKHKEKISDALKNKPKDPIAVQNAVNARKEKGSYKANDNQKLACSHPVSVDGEIYPSISEAAKAKGMSHQTALNRIKSENFPGWVKVSDHSNQV